VLGLLGWRASVKAGAHELDCVSGITDWDLRDCRRTAMTLMQRAGVPLHIADAVLGHVITGVTAHYAHHNYTTEKRTLWKPWQGWCSTS
jgi:integrase